MEAVRDERLLADTAALHGHQLRVHLQRALQARVHVRARGEVAEIDEAALADFAIRNRSVEVAVAALHDRLRAVEKLLRREALMVERETGATELGVDAVAERLRDPALVGSPRRAEGHVDGDRVAVVERHWLRRQLVHRRPGMPVRDSAELAVLKQVRALELQHLLHALLRNNLSDR